MEYIAFKDENKIKFFDELTHYFYERNFGKMSKADMEVLMFHFYMEEMISKYKNEDGTIDYKKCSDYYISKELGITQQRVRNLKIKKELFHPTEYDWKKALATLTEHARYDKVTKKVLLNIPDPNLYIEIQNFIEEQGAYVEKQLNSKVLQIRAEYYIALATSLEESGDVRKRIIKELKNACKKDAEFDEKDIGKSLIEGAVNLTTLAANLSTIFTSPIGIALTGLIKQFA